MLPEGITMICEHCFSPSRVFERWLIEQDLHDVQSSLLLVWFSHCTLIMLIPRFTVIESPFGVEIKTVRLPSAEPALTVTVAVSEEPSPLTTMFETMMVVSVVPLAVMNRSAVAPDKPTPLTVRVTTVPRVILPGERL
jgi:hypothetical protein